MPVRCSEVIPLEARQFYESLTSDDKQVAYWTQIWNSPQLLGAPNRPQQELKLHKREPSSKRLAKRVHHPLQQGGRSRDPNARDHRFTESIGPQVRRRCSVAIAPHNFYALIFLVLKSVSQIHKALGEGFSLGRSEARYRQLWTGIVLWTRRQRRS